MRIFIPQVLERQVWTVPRRETDNLRLYAVNGPRETAWLPVPMQELLKDDRGRQRHASDMPWYNEHLLVLRKTALAALRPELERYGEFLDLIADTPLTLFNVTVSLEALEEDKSEIVRFDDGSVLMIERHVFRPDAIGSTQVFRLRLRNGGYRVSPIYLQESLIDTFREVGIRGVGFALVWDEDRPSVGQELIEL
ncbi:hypothetical protein [Tabrizicola sp.]|uniref:hypothetical protein n=1 Tax=Tabrizicola sp. TaxID=2005166 RepID=UPI003F3BFC9A